MHVLNLVIAFYETLLKELYFFLQTFQALLELYSRIPINQTRLD